MKYENKVLTIDGNNYLVIETIETDNRVFALLTNDNDDSDSSFVEILEENSSIEVKAIDGDFFEEKIFPLFADISNN